MAETKIEIGLSPEEVVAALSAMGDEVKKFQAVIEDALGKKASQAVNDLKDTADKGTNAITKFFSNMGTRIREDLKTAFDVSSVIAGAKFAREIGEGVKSVLDMERAFDRLNVRMGLSTTQMAEFKRTAGRATADAGVNLQDIQPGLLSAASRGGVRDPKQMSIIAGVLAQSRQINPQLDAGTAMDDVAEILKRQHLDINGENVRKTFDAINAATVRGGFKNSNDAAAQLAHMSGTAGMLGMDTRTMAGLAAVASKSGDTGEDILRQILSKGTGLDRGQAFNAQVGADVFKNGKLDPQALGRIDTSRFGNISPQVLEKITGVSGASGADFKQFVETMRDSMGDFDKVVNGMNETADEFGTATQSTAAKIEMFKARVTQAGAEIGESIMEMVTGLANQDSSNKGLQHLAGSVWHNKGDLAVAGGLSLGAAMLTGGGIRSLLGGKIADAQGIQKVYVTNAGEIAGESSVGTIAKYGSTALNYGKTILANAAILGGESLSGIAGMGAGAIISSGAAVAGAGYAGYQFGKHIVNPLVGNDGQLGEMAADWMYGNGGGGGMSTEQLSDAVYKGHLKATMEAETKRRLPSATNPSRWPSQGGGR
jgi:hypothetical protein